MLRMNVSKRLEWLKWNPNKEVKVGSNLKKKGNGEHEIRHKCLKCVAPKEIDSASTEFSICHQIYLSLIEHRLVERHFPIPKKRGMG